MLGRLRFKTKIQLLPGFAGLAFIALILINLMGGRENTARLEDIERVHYPALEASRDLVDLLETTQRTFLDAATAQDGATLAKAGEVRSQFLAKVATLDATPVVDDAEIAKIRGAYESYVELASTVVRRMISEEQDEHATAGIEKLTADYNALQAAVAQLSTNQRALMRDEFVAARKTSSDATRANVIIGAFCLVGLMIMSLWIIRSVVNTLAEASGYVSAAVAEILAVAQQTEANAADEAAFVDETRRAMDGLVDSASAIATSASAVLDRAELSASASRTVAGRISELNAQALKITDVSDTIRGIADKSDILALNASLEGSRAGDAGRGFALVGAEMRRLAETVMGAVTQIKRLANEIREVSQAAVLATEEGQKLAAETTQTSRTITLITSQQRTATEQVTQSVNEIQQFTRQAVNGAKQSRAAAADLLRTTGHLDVLLSGKNVGGAPAVAAPSAPASAA
jgi:methyl-accepting chemotaxis protein